MNSLKIATRISILIILLCASALISGCSVLPQSDEPRTYIMQVQRNQSDSAPPAPEIPIPVKVDITPVSANKPFNLTTFQVRTSRHEWKEDYYHRLTGGPDVQVTQLLRNWLADSRRFASVLLPVSYSNPDVIVHGHLLEFYIDTQNDTPSAIVTFEVEFITAKNATRPDSSVTSFKYHQSITLKDSVPESAVAGWESALHNIFLQLEKDLTSIISP